MVLGGCGGDPTTPPATQEVADLGASPLVAESAPAEVAETTAEPAPVVETRTVTEKKRIRYSTREVEDSSLAEGTRRTRTRGRDGVRTLTYEVTFTDGEPSGRKLTRSEVTRKPVTIDTSLANQVAPAAPVTGTLPGQAQPVQQHLLSWSLRSVSESTGAVPM